MINSLSSPEYIKTSLSSSMALRFASGRFYMDAKPYCINLLLTYPEPCLGGCSYCGLARSRQIPRQDSRSFIRVDWPVLETREVLERLARYETQIRRVCLSMVLHPRATEDALRVARGVKEKTSIPLSILITPSLCNTSVLDEFRQLGVDWIGVGLDAASPRIFSRIRGGLRWQNYWERIIDGVEVFGRGRVSCHVMVGVGETEEELAGLFFKLREVGARAHLFSFYPEAGSEMSRQARPTLKKFRRAQLLRYLVEEEGLKGQALEFDGEGRLCKIAAPQDIIEKVIASGRPFLTGGCTDRHGGPACNRPFGSYRPGESFRDFPFHPEPEDIKKIRGTLKLQEIL